ncbi:MAG: mandelate racemase/muconate lactonizing enzyme family protein [Actinomycetota bacterium]|nr:mandelate racemase/muconate lactonizing enzyme family protein [Actinomycetota bacterium]
MSAEETSTERSRSARIAAIRAVNVRFPERKIVSEVRRANWNDYAPRGLPMNRYFPPDLPAKTPGIAGSAVWVQVVTEGGEWGLGRCSFGEPVAALVNQHFAPLLIGRDALATEMLNDIMWRSTKRHGSVGLSAIAQSGIDLALWDLKGKLFGEPVYRLIGGPSRESVRCYCTSDDLDWSLELGFDAFKLSNPVFYEQGNRGLDLIEEKIAAGRATVGASAELMFNPVMAFNVRFAIEVCERVRPYRLSWLEEPLIPEDLEGHLQLRSAVPWMGIATGEDHHTRIPFRQLIERRAVDVVQPDLQWCGGLTEALKIYAMAEAAGIRTIPHAGCNSPFGQHFAFAMPDCDLGEFHLSSPIGVPLAEWNSIPGMAVPEKGRLVPSDAPGFGMDIPQDWLEPWTTDAANGVGVW